ncbi:PREDICTED: beta-1,3-galactosyltransferase 6 [Ceratosolen solmsi marchali]|uniref:Hexosyltransferase n=1 Tax=Ceratosolen solmsi marchali TaxID=326594 RepID=A0AAJ6YBZ7_9HYME|nr:PREDICTED: beta-1,3-galactosyltransferase 6 [Ceratosolen solmsi marchali]
MLNFYRFSLKCSTKNKKLVNKPKFHLIILVLSGPENVERRNSIRETWLSQKQTEVKNLFPIGLIKLRLEQKQAIESENEKFKDLLLLPELLDSYGTVTKKILQSFVHVYENYDFNYLLKGDDDSFILVDKILNDLDKWQKKGSKKELYWGYFNGRARVKKSGPWKEVDWFLCDYYLPYALGGGYVLSYNLVKFIVKNVDVLK